MSFPTYETSRSLGQPDILIRFTSGDNVYGYTDAEEAITFAGTTYEPLPLDRDAVTSSGNLDKSTFRITLPVSAPIAELFRVFPPSEVVSCVMLQGHGSDPDHQFIAVWSGRVLSCSRAKSRATLSCEPISTSMRRPGLRRRYQYGCPHVLYGPYCRADRAAFSVTATVVAVNGTYITMAAGWPGALDQAKFANGIMVAAETAQTDIRTILKVVPGENTIIISAAIGGLTVGSAITLSLGCNRQMGDCLNVFNNIHNFGGHPWIPKTNPLSNEAQFY
ncbi:phage BR0599 family protein [Sphingomonas sp. RB3P16]|uniref:phage BR0599 family protein n=1 Tax=Parasphingomonas frigoris TaxID=3096163 RepID=UPI002FC8DC3F